MPSMNRLERLIALAHETERLARALEAALPNHRDAPLADAVFPRQIDDHAAIAGRGVDRHAVIGRQDARPSEGLIQPPLLARVR